MRARDERTATETSGAEEKTQKNLRGGGGIPPPLYVRGFMSGILNQNVC